MGHDQAPALVEHFFRHEYGRVVGALVRTFGAGRLAEVEDAVQTAMAIALTSWAQRGVPDNPGAWLTRTARNAVLDRLRHAQVVERAQTPHGAPADPPPAARLANEIDDDALRMLFVCCHEGLKPRARLILALKILCGFSIEEIALRLFMSVAAVRKQITRARARLRALSPSLDDPAPSRLAARQPAVHQVIYLLFNEGYSSARADEPIRRELCDEALRLGRLLCDHPVATGDSWALLALMTLHQARLDARLDAAGELLRLEEQDRTRWDRRLIGVGMGCLMRAGHPQPPSRYHLEAAILVEHCSAPSYAETNWADIATLYRVLEQLYPSPLHTLNRAIAVAEWQGPEAGLALLEALTPPAWLARYYVWSAALGELNRRAGRPERARPHLEAALAGAPTHAEQRRLRGWLAALG